MLASCLNEHPGNSNQGSSNLVILMYHTSEPHAVTIMDRFKEHCDYISLVPFLSFMCSSKNQKKRLILFSKRCGIIIKVC